MADSLYSLPSDNYFLDGEDITHLIQIKENADTISDEEISCYSYETVKHFRKSLLKLGKVLEKHHRMLNIPSSYSIIHAINEYITKIEKDTYYVSPFIKFVKLLKRSTFVPNASKEKLSYIRNFMNSVTDEEIERKWLGDGQYIFRQALHIFNMWLKMHNIT